jgi:RNA polymerase sigma-70 factor (ECF subfamily)
VISQKQFGAIYDRYVDKIYRFVFLKVNSQLIAQDLTSETFTRTLEYVKRNPNIQIDNIQAFLYRTANNIITDHYRQKSRKDVPLDYESQEIVRREVPDRDRPDVAVAQGEQMSQIRTALARLEGETADVVRWHYVEDLSIKEIAEITGRPEGTVRVMLHRGLEELKALLV